MTINIINSITPPFLKKGEYIEIIAPAKFINKLDLQEAINFLEKEGLRVKLNDRIFDKKDVFAGSISHRKKTFQDALNNSETKAILFARGGYGSIQILDFLDFSFFQKNPKWLIGFSDTTSILTHVLTCYNIKSIHAPMAYNFKKTDPSMVQKLINLLMGNWSSINVRYHNLNKTGSCSGFLIGGNLSILSSLTGSSTLRQLSKNKYILFIEDVDEYLYAIERMMYTLERAGILENLQGLIVGQMTQLKDNDMPFGKTANQLIHDIVTKYNYPIAFNFPVGHTQHNCPVIIGSEIKMNVNKNFSEIIYVK